MNDGNEFNSGEGIQMFNQQLISKSSQFMVTSKLKVWNLLNQLKIATVHIVGSLNYYSKMLKGCHMVYMGIVVVYVIYSFAA